MKALTYGGAALITLLTVAPIQAADLGGNCCADLEERVAELEATTARKGNRKVTLEVSGHINEAFYTGTLTDDNWEIGNNPNNSGRFRFKGAAKINANWSAGFLMEIGVNHGGLSVDDATNIRHQALYIKSNTLGTVWLGHTSAATDGIVEIDLSNASVGSTLANVSVLGLGVMDGSRADVVRYISPELGGFNISVSWEEEDAYDAALRYAGEFGAIRVAAGIGYRREANDNEVISGSASVKHLPTGFGGSAFYGDNSKLQEISFLGFTIGTPEVDVEQWGVRLFIDKKVTPLGKTTLYGEYSDAEVSFSTGGAKIGDVNAWRIGIVQNIEAAAMDFYAVYGKVEINPVGDDSITADEFIAGARIQF